MDKLRMLSVPSIEVISTEQQERIGYMAIEAELAVLLGSQISDL